MNWLILCRFRFIRSLSLRFIAPKGRPFVPTPSATRILLGGDVSFDRDIRDQFFLSTYPNQGQLQQYTLWRKIWQKLTRRVRRILLSPKFYSSSIYASFVEPLVQTPENHRRRFISSYYKRCIKFNIGHSPSSSQFAYPFAKLAPFMKERHIVMVNLETPLTINPRPHGLFISDPSYAKAMKDAGISIVSLANNHIFDRGTKGFLDTIEHLKKVGISYVGAGMNLEDARLGKKLYVEGKKFHFLSYTQFCNNRFASIASTYPGILPLDTELIVEDVIKAKDRVDFVFVSLHWGIENQPCVQPKQVKIAHAIVDAGADCVVGHHPHVPHGIEIYKKKPIFYSLGNFIFGQGSASWRGDNILAEVLINDRYINGVVIYPISGLGQELFQPELLNGERADSLLHELQIKSTVFSTPIAIYDHFGYIKIE